MLPTDSASRPATVDALLLVDPVRAERQRQSDVDRPQPREPGPVRPSPSIHQKTKNGSSRRSHHVRPLTRFFGATTLNPDFYARDFGRITSEVIQHLAAVDGVDLEVRLEISAVAKNGFDEAKVRTVSENAQTLKFEQSGFETE